MPIIDALNQRLESKISDKDSIPILEERSKHYKICENYEAAGADLLRIFRLQKTLGIPIRNNLIMDVLDCYLKAENADQSYQTLMPLIVNSKSPGLIPFGSKVIDLLLGNHLLGQKVYILTRIILIKSSSLPTF